MDAVDMTVENTTDHPYALSSVVSLVLLDKDSRSHTVTFGALLNGSLDGTIAANQKLRGEALFEVAIGTAPFVVRYRQPFGPGSADWEVTPVSSGQPAALATIRRRRGRSRCRTALRRLHLNG
jgi:hypothetical protein